MVKVAQKRANKTSRQISNDVSSRDYDDSIASTAISNVNSTDVTTNGLVDVDVENSGYVQQSGVWKYATKVGPEKARCNICQIGKHL